MSWALLLQFTRQDLVDRHASSALGALWSFILPLVNILIFTLIFSNIMGAKLQMAGLATLGQYSYSVYLITALLAWNCFASTTTRLTNILHEKAGLITKVRLSIYTLPLFVPITETILYLISMLFFAVFLVGIGFEWSTAWLWWPFIFITQQLLAYALGFTFAILSVFIRDIKELVGIIMQLWFWMTPIVYVPDIIPPAWQSLLALNPYYHIAQALRDTMITGASPSLTPVLLILTAALTLLLFGYWLARRLERDIRDFL
jgi:lipopolysaccharide transport system permease protein